VPTYWFFYFCSILILYNQFLYFLLTKNKTNSLAASFPATRSVALPRARSERGSCYDKFPARNMRAGAKTRHDVARDG